MKYFKRIILPALLLAILYVLFFQPQLLMNNLSVKHPFPLGTLVAWLFVLFYSVFFHLVIPLENKHISNRILKVALQINVLISAVWGFVSFALAGNWNFVFDNKSNFNIWIIITSGLVLIPVFVTIYWFLSKSIFRRKQ